MRPIHVSNRVGPSDRRENRIYAAPIRSACRFLAGQHPPPPVLTPGELAEVETAL
jgi:hypothetical protein